MLEIIIGAIATLIVGIIVFRYKKRYESKTASETSHLNLLRSVYSQIKEIRKKLYTVLALAAWNIDSHITEEAASDPIFHLEAMLKERAGQEPPATEDCITDLYDAIERLGETVYIDLNIPQLSDALKEFLDQFDRMDIINKIIYAKGDEELRDLLELSNPDEITALSGHIKVEEVREALDKSIEKLELLAASMLMRKTS